MNPSRLSKERQIELCFQCHLESTSRRLPYSIRRYGRGLFSYRPGEPLGNYILHFDHAPGTGNDDKFEIAGAAYRLLKSACFTRSKSALTCVTCHDPHEPSQGETAMRRYASACRSCHASAHNISQNCVECHMPKRRTSDVVHVVMTDHSIQRKPGRDLLAPLRELHDTGQTAYRGDVAPLYPATLTGEDELYLAVAQVTEGANLEGGIGRLRKAIETYRPAQAEFYFELANACWKNSGADPLVRGRPPGRLSSIEQAIEYYEQALRRKPDYPEARRNYAIALSAAGRVSDGAKALQSSDDAASLNALGAAYLNLGKLDQAVTALRRALRIDSELPEIYVNLGNALSRKGNQADATDALRSAIRLSPSLAAAHSNLATLLNLQGDFAQAQYHFRRAIRSDPANAAAHYNYGHALAERKLLAEAESELSIAAKIDPQLAEAAVSLGMVFAQAGQLDRAIEQYRRAIQIKPDFTVAHFNLGLALMRQRDNAEAKQHFEAVLQSNPRDPEAHLYLGRILLSEGNQEAAADHLRKAGKR